jgi:hypothetical protein
MRAAGALFASLCLSVVVAQQVIRGGSYPPNMPGSPTRVTNTDITQTGGSASTTSDPINDVANTRSDFAVTNINNPVSVALSCFPTCLKTSLSG